METVITVRGQEIRDPEITTGDRQVVTGTEKLGWIEGGREVEVR